MVIDVVSYTCVFLFLFWHSNLWVDDLESGSSYGQNVLRICHICLTQISSTDGV